MNLPVPDRTLTELDHVRLTHLLARAGLPAHPLHDVLDGADLVPSREIAPDTVTMNSRVTLRGPAAAPERTVVLRYPAEADAAAGGLSVLSPLGTQLIGLRAGDTVAWSTPDGRTQSADIAAVLFQPEAEGEYLA